MVKTGARAETLAKLLAEAGIARVAERTPAPRIRDLDERGVDRIASEFKAFGGDIEQLEKLRPGAWDLVFEGGLIVELDEELHFNRYRAQTLQAVWARDLPWTEAYLLHCSAQESRCLSAAKWGKRWTNPSCERLFGPPGEPGDFSTSGAPRWKQRALYDAMKDAYALGRTDTQLARISTHDRVEGRDLDGVLRDPHPGDAHAVAELLHARVLRTN